MAKHNAANARIKREYFTYLKEAQRRDEGSIDAVAKALARFEEANGHKDFKTFHRAQAVAFKHKLDKQPAVRTGKPLSRATVNSTLSALRAFFVWLAGQPGYKSRLSYADADYFNLAEKDVRIAKAARHKAFPTLEQVHHVIGTMPTGTAIELRNRALVAFALLTGALHHGLGARAWQIAYANLQPLVVLMSLTIFTAALAAPARFSPAAARAVGTVTPLVLGIWWKRCGTAVSKRFTRHLGEWTQRVSTRFTCCIRTDGASGSPGAMATGFTRSSMAPVFTSSASAVSERRIQLASSGFVSSGLGPSPTGLPMQTR